MDNSQLSRRWLVILVSLHVFLWTLIPAITRTVLPLDTIEGLTWGHAWQWGYDKNPYLNAWVSEIFSYLGYDWPQYFVSSLCVALCFWAIYKLGRCLFSPIQAASAAFLLEGIYYLNIASPQFNDNMLELGLWPAAAYFFYKAIDSQKVKYWLLTGLALGLAFMAKYLTAILMLPMFLFLLVNRSARRSFLLPGVYLAIIPFFILVLPHLMWLHDNSFITIAYAFDRAERTWVWSNHIFYAAKFAGEQALALLPSVLMSLWFLRSRDPSNRLSTFNKQFLWFVCAGPFIALLLLSMIRGYALEPMWGVPFLAPFVLVIMACWKPVVTYSRFKGLFATSMTLVLLVTSAFGISMAFSPFSSNCKATGYYPGREIANAVTKVWYEHTDKPFKYVAGPRWVAGNVAYYSKDRPQVYMEVNPEVSTWINEDEFKQDGAMFVWSIKHGSHPHLPSGLKKRFPSLEILPSKTFTQGSCQIKVGMAILTSP